MKSDGGNPYSTSGYLGKLAPGRLKEATDRLNPEGYDPVAVDRFGLSEPQREVLTRLRNKVGNDQTFRLTEHLKGLKRDIRKIGFSDEDISIILSI